MSKPHEVPPPLGDVALVLGGGGAAGQAWQIGVIAGLAEAGLDLASAAALVIGTSSGATTAAWVRSGIPPAHLFVSVLSEPTRSMPPGRERPVSPSTDALFQRMRAIGAAAGSAAELQRAMGAFGLESDAGFPPEAADQRRAMVASRLPHHEWSDRAMVVAVLDAHTGALVTFDSGSGVDLVDAVTAATALPGGTPTVGIAGARYVNGGVRSAENADLASGYRNVVVLSPFGGRSGPLPEGQFEGLRRFPGTDLPSQVETLRGQGSHVELITPDVDSETAMGTNQMDPATRIPSARAGHAQGKRCAGRVTLR